ncbi:sugar phosphate nucleotidyltransferase [Methanobrevibacter sp.]|uniref:sugar phosphate nucleotidyltransferase n=1 Tax=Methanobrevibacter sp. TaxID=66852 RepID=UPI003867B3C4
MCNDIQHYTITTEAFGVVEFDDNDNVLSVEENPKRPKSNYIIPGLYLYDHNTILIKKIKKYLLDNLVK